MNRIRELRMQHGYTQDYLGSYLGVQKSAICKYENGRANPPQESLILLSELFAVSIDYILGREDPALYNSKAQNIIPIPIVGKVHAGSPILAEENIYDYVFVPEGEIRSGDYFYMEVEGDCMIDAHIVEGALVLVRMQNRVENGQIAVVRVNDEVVLRRVKWLQNQLILYPANPNYEPLIIASGDVQIIGRVVETRIRNL